jgi:hypothetical protein
MRGIRTAGVGIGLALATSVGSAQDAGAPAAKLGRIQATDPSAGVVVRAQATDSARPPSPMPPLSTAAGVSSGAAQPGSTTLLHQPQPLGGPSVTELRGAPPYAGPPATFGTPVPYGTPVTVGQPIVVSPPSVLPCDQLACPAPNLDAPLCGGGCGPLGTLTGPNKFQVYADLLLWWVGPAHAPPLVTTSSPQFNGILGTGDTQVLYPDGSVNNTFHTGGRFGGVYWLGCDTKWGLDGNIWFLGRNGTESVFGPGATGVLARPFFNLNQGVPFAELVASPGLATGSVAVHTETTMWGAEANMRRYLASTCCSRLDLFFGFRYVGLKEELTVTEAFARSPGSPTSIGVPTVVSGSITDRVRTENNFYGAQVGLAGEVRRGRWFAEGRASVAMGDVFQTAELSGGQLLQFTTGPAAFPGGLLVLPGANMGTFRREEFAVVPEVGVKLGYHLTPHLRLAVGYNFLYLSRALRPGDQLDTGLDVTRIPNFPVAGTVPPLQAVRPTVPLKESGVFAQGITFSLQYNW